MSPQHPRALVVDDDPQYRLLLRYVLGDAGIETAEAGPAQDVVEVARRERPDVILLDWRMPGTSGLQLCRDLRADEAVRDVPVVMLTGLSDPRDHASALAAGATAMVTKGSSIDLVDLVRRTVAVPDADGRDRHRA